MQRTKRSDGVTRRGLVGVRSGRPIRIPGALIPRGSHARALLSCGGLLLILAAAGCRGIDVLAPQIPEIVGDPFHYEVKNLSAAQLEEGMKAIDLNFQEPRYFGKVNHSYADCLQYISKENDYAALWRGARACAWIAMDESLPRSQRKEFASNGIKIGRESVLKTSAQAESHYYLALCMGAFSDISGTATREWVRSIAYHSKMALELDEKLDNCGPHRVLGQLMVETDEYPTYAVGTLEQGLIYLKKATVLCPDYGENHLVYAKALKLDDQLDLARAELEKVVTSPKPRDRSAEHQAWLEDANRLLTDIQGN
ncbi:MAG TPA: hypothetical protein VMT52_17065 [Planctomycetota bacterium]|nr:hypothetical protein [Planctomycetota bacterium]